MTKGEQEEQFFSPQSVPFNILKGRRLPRHFRKGWDKVRARGIGENSQKYPAVYVLTYLQTPTNPTLRDLPNPSFLYNPLFHNQNGILNQSDSLFQTFFMRLQMLSLIYFSFVFCVLYLLERA